MAARAILRSVGLLAGLAALGCGSASGGTGSAEPPAAAGAPRPAQVAAADASESIDLGGTWEVWLDPADAGLSQGWVAALTAGEPPPSGPSEPLRLAVPGPLEGHASTLDYDGVAFYARTVLVPAEARPSAARALLRFEQVDYACTVWLDGEPVGEHEGGYEPFTLDLTGKLLGGVEQRLVVRVVDPGAAPVDGLTLRTTPHGKQSWYENFGGLLGPVTLQLVRGWSVREGTLRVDVEPEPGHERVALSGELLAPPGERWPDEVALELRLYDVQRLGSPNAEAAGVRVSGPATSFRIEVRHPDARRWSPESPSLYRAELRANGVPIAERTVGFRSIAIDGGDFRIDGARRTLKGVLWQPHFTGTGGVTPPPAELAATARAMQAAGFDLVRAHVRPAPPAFLDECDRIGLLVLEEPAIGWLDDDPALEARLLREVSWMVERDRHRPAVVMWGVLNELSGRAYRHVDALVERVAQLDPTRPVLEDSGAFRGEGRVRPPGAAASVPMIDKHWYPPYPLPPEERDELLALDDPGGGLVFVSEFGHGTLLDTQAALAPFTERDAMTNERIDFASWAGLARRSRQPAAGAEPAWWQLDWTERAAQVQARAAADLIDVLRANPAIDLLCYTQWQAASEESSAGLIGPWGEPRPALESVRAALAPFQVVFVPGRSSLRPGEQLSYEAAMINDTGESLGGSWGITGLRDGMRVTGQAAYHETWDPGVSRTRISPMTLPLEPGFVTLTARCTGSSSARVQFEVDSAPRIVRVAGPVEGLGEQRPAWALKGGREQVALESWGFARTELEDIQSGQPVVALIGDPARLRAQLPLADWLRLWAGVHRGGAAVVVVPGPAESEVERSLGLLRGVRTFTALPLPASVASAPGHFMARVHAIREGDSARLLGRGDEAFSPEGMLVDPPAGCDERIVTLGWLGNRLGDPDVVLSFGRGTIRVIGLPLLRPIEGVVDPARDEMLARAVSEAAREAAARLEPDGSTAPSKAWSPPSAAELARLEVALDRLDRLVALGDRQTPFTGDEPRLPAPLAAALAARTAALEALFAGDAAGGVQALEAAVAPLWSEAAERFLDREEAVLRAWSERVAAGGITSWEGGFDVRQAWIAAVADWFAGRADAAQAGIDRAWDLLQER